MYRKRLVEKELARKMASSGAVVVYGPKFCGKTTTCMQYQKSVIRLNTRRTISLAQMDPRSALVGDTPRLIDEWQTVPDIWNQIKADLDEEYAFGKYILTGSSTPVDKTDIRHSGAGRIAPVKMRPMTLMESGESDGTVSLSRLFDGSGYGTVMDNDFSIDELAFLICRGGWPISVLASRDVALDVTDNYYSGLFMFENNENEKFRGKSPEILRMIMRSYARNISSEAAVSTIIADIAQNGERAIDRKTFDLYVEALRDLYIIDDLQAWSPDIRSKTSIRTTPTRHFTDTSLACRALSLAPEDLKRDLNTFGLMFEDFAVRDISVYASVLGGEVRHYRDNAGLECDAVVHLPDGSWGAIEIKLGGEDAVEKGASSLRLLKRKVEEKGSGRSPAFLMVLTGVGPAYRRPDGVHVAPINFLGP